MSAIKKAMGIKSRYFLISDVRKFIRNNPEFKSKSAEPGETMKVLLVAALNELRLCTRSLQAPNPKLIQRIERKLEPFDLASTPSHKTLRNYPLRISNHISESFQSDYALHK
jgi:hypothetical protein